MIRSLKTSTTSENVSKRITTRTFRKNVHFFSHEYHKTGGVQMDLIKGNRLSTITQIKLTKHSNLNKSHLLSLILFYLKQREMRSKYATSSVWWCNKTPDLGLNTEHTDRPVRRTVRAGCYLCFTLHAKVNKGRVTIRGGEGGGRDWPHSSYSSSPISLKQEASS